jgi:hypothetical protein
MTSAKGEHPRLDGNHLSRRARSVAEACLAAAADAAASKLLAMVFVPGPSLPRPGLDVLDTWVTLDGAPRLGRATAVLAVIEFSDFDCHACRRFAESVWPDFKVRFIDTGRVQVSFRHFPQPSVPAQRLARAAACADAQGRFWPMARALWADAPPLTDVAIVRRATAEGLGVGAFASCMDDRRQRRVREDFALGYTAGVRQPPTFLVGLVRTHDEVQVRATMFGVVPTDAFDRAFVTLTGKR